MAKKAENSAPTTTRLTKDDVVVETTLATEVAELRANGFTVDEGTKPASAASGSAAS